MIVNVRYSLGILLIADNVEPVIAKGLRECLSDFGNGLSYSTRKLIGQFGNVFAMRLWYDESVTRSQREDV